jgi:hypothetical protein
VETVHKIPDVVDHLRQEQKSASGIGWGVVGVDLEGFTKAPLRA